MTRGSLIAAVLVLGATAMAACSSPAGTGLPHGHTYVGVTATEGGKTHALVPGTLLSVGFNATQLSYTGSCNSHGGDARIEDGRLVLADFLTATQRYCGDAIETQERWLGGLLAGKPTLAVNGNTLTLTAGTKSVTLTEETVADMSPVLIDAHWYADYLPAPRNEPNLPPGVVPTLEFGAGGQLTGNTGCREVTTTWKWTSGYLTFGPLTVGKRACPGALAVIDRAVLAALAGKVRMSLDAGSLMITAASGSGMNLVAR
jgi:heat shock protein HslJ